MMGNPGTWILTLFSSLMLTMLEVTLVLSLSPGSPLCVLCPGWGEQVVSGDSATVGGWERWVACLACLLWVWSTLSWAESWFVRTPSNPEKFLREDFMIFGGEDARFRSGDFLTFLE